jgi:hypothetical protein
MLTEDDAGNVRSVTRHQPGASRLRNRSLYSGEVGTVKAGMRLVYWTVKNGYTDLGVGFE